MVNKCKVTKKDGNWTTLKCGTKIVQVKHFSEPSNYGIKRGKISKLWIRDMKTKKDLVNYDRGWDIMPKKEVKTIYNKILKEYN